MVDGNFLHDFRVGPAFLWLLRLIDRRVYRPGPATVRDFLQVLFCVRTAVCHFSESIHRYWGVVRTYPHYLLLDIHTIGASPDQ